MGVLPPPLPLGFSVPEPDAEAAWATGALPVGYRPLERVDVTTRCREDETGDVVAVKLLPPGPSYSALAVALGAPKAKDDPPPGGHAVERHWVVADPSVPGRVRRLLPDTEPRWLVSDWVLGRNLAAGEPLPPPMSTEAEVRWAAPAPDTTVQVLVPQLRRLHDAGWVHGAVAPGNVILPLDPGLPVAVLVDFANTVPIGKSYADPWPGRFHSHRQAWARQAGEKGLIADPADDWFALGLLAVWLRARHAGLARDDVERILEAVRWLGPGEIPSHLDPLPEEMVRWLDPPSRLHLLKRSPSTASGPTFGTPLHDAVDHATGDPASAAALVDLLPSVIDACEHTLRRLHADGWVHGGVSPSTVYVTADVLQRPGLLARPEADVRSGAIRQMPVPAFGAPPGSGRHASQSEDFAALGATAVWAAARLEGRSVEESHDAVAQARTGTAQHPLETVPSLAARLGPRAVEVQEWVREPAGTGPRPWGSAVWFWLGAAVLFVFALAVVVAGLTRRDGGSGDDRDTTAVAADASGGQAPTYDPASGQYAGWPSADKPELAEGSTGPDVEYLQSVLRFEAGQDIVIDGKYGPQTEEAVKRFQGAYSLEVTGWVNDDTWAVVDDLAAAAGAG
jgi:hypothetical protein